MWLSTNFFKLCCACASVMLDPDSKGSSDPLSPAVRSFIFELYSLETSIFIFCIGCIYVAFFFGVLIRNWQHQGHTLTCSSGQRKGPSCWCCSFLHSISIQRDNMQFGFSLIHSLPEEEIQKANSSSKWLMSVSCPAVSTCEGRWSGWEMYSFQMSIIHIYI